MSTDEGTRVRQASLGLRIWRIILIVLCLFVAIGALAGLCIAFIPGLDALVGADEIIPVLQQTPYVGSYINSLIIPGIFLLLLVFLPQLTASIHLLRWRKRQYRSGISAGAFLIVCMIGELILIPSFLAWIYLGIGAAQICVGVVCLVLRSRNRNKFI